MVKKPCDRVTNRKTETKMDDIKVGSPTVFNNMAQYCTQRGFHAIAMANFLVVITKNRNNRKLGRHLLYIPGP